MSSKQQRRRGRDTQRPSAPADAVAYSHAPGRLSSNRAIAVFVLCAFAAGIGLAWLLARSPAAKVSSSIATTAPTAIMGDGITGPEGMAWVPAGEFVMGSEHELAQANERPTHRVRVQGFWMDRTHVTNDEFRTFVDATGYVTTAERKPRWEDLRVQLPPGTPAPPDEALVPGAMVFVGTDAPVDLDDVSRWWRFVPGANWQHPRGPGSNVDGKGDHPVVQVSHEDVQAYARWRGKRLPTEAEWEYAARGGLEQATYAWGEAFKPDGRRMANVWDVSTKGRFPVVSATVGGAEETSRVGTFPPNGYGLVDMTGNAWQWTADWYRADYFKMQTERYPGEVIDDPGGPSDSWDPADRSAIPEAPRRVIRGGSFLCNVDYCLSYRPSARRGNDPFNPMSHLGFRLVQDAPPPNRRRAIRARETASTDP